MSTFFFSVLDAPEIPTDMEEANLSVADSSRQPLWPQNYRLKDRIKQLLFEPEVNSYWKSATRTQWPCAGFGLDGCCNISLSLVEPGRPILNDRDRPVLDRLRLAAKKVDPGTIQRR